MFFHLVFETFTEPGQVPDKIRSPACPKRGGWRGVLPSSRLMGMCRWMGSYLHAWRQKIQVCRDLKIERFTLH